MGEEQALAAIQCFDCCHIFCGQREIKQIKVLLHPLFVGGFRNDNHIALKQETKGGLSHGLAVLLTDFCQYRIGEHIVASLCERSPGLNLTTVLFQIFLCGLLLLEHMSLDLIYGRLYFCKMLDIQITVRAKVGNTDGTDLSCFVKLFHSTEVP